MKDLIRKCYQEAGITDANAKRFENRVTAIQHILDSKDFFEKEDWAILTKWAVGAVSDSVAESQLIDLEEAFCETDEAYTNENIILTRQKQKRKKSTLKFNLAADHR